MVVRPARLRVVLDTNLFVAAYWNPRSAPARVLEACEESQLRLLSSAAIRREMDYILRKAHTSEAFQHRVSLLLETRRKYAPRAASASCRRTRRRQVPGVRPRGRRRLPHQQ